MKEQNVARAYAMSLMDLASENKVDAVKELTSLTELINSSNALENLFFLNVFTIDEKLEICKVVSEKLGLSPIVRNFLTFLVQEKRIGILPLIFKQLVVIDDHNKGFLRGVIEGSDNQVSPQFLEKIKSYLKSKLGANAILDYKVNSSITAGYRVTVQDLQVDASVDRQLGQFKESFSIH